MAPLKPADDAVLIDTTGMPIDAVVARVLALVPSPAPEPDAFPAQAFAPGECTAQSAPRRRVRRGIRYRQELTRPARCAPDQRVDAASRILADTVAQCPSPVDVGQDHVSFNWKPT